MISWIRDYTVQSIFVAIQATIIIYGIMVTGTLLKVNGYPEFDQFAWYSLFVRHAGFLVLIIPGFWVWLTIWYDLSDRVYPEAFTIVTGIVLMFLLYQFFSLSAAGADRRWGVFREVTQISQPQIYHAEQAMIHRDRLIIDPPLLLEVYRSLQGQTIIHPGSKSQGQVITLQT